MKTVTIMKWFCFFGIFWKRSEDKPEPCVCCTDGLSSDCQESIFTGLNNFKVYSITNMEFDETFGFTDAEVREMLQYYELIDKYEEVKEWYDGYRFGNTEVYCPWDVVNYCSDHVKYPNAAPENYWMNTSGNNVMNRFIDSVQQPDMLTKAELGWLVNGETVVKK